MSAPLVRAEGIGLVRGGRPVLEGVDLAVWPGEIVTVIGPNGGGKTSLLRILIGALRPDRGRVVRRPGLRVGYTPQKMQIERTIPVTVERFLALTGPLAPGTRAEVLRRVGVEALRRAQLSDLSGGEMQRVLLARALLRAPDLLVLDEPTQGLDPPAEAAFYRLIAELRAERGVGVLLVSHDLHVVMGASDRVVCLNGHVCCAGRPEAVSADPAYRALFGARADLALYRHHHDHSHEHGAEAGGQGPAPVRDDRATMPAPAPAPAPRHAPAPGPAPVPRHGTDPWPGAADVPQPGPAGPVTRRAAASPVRWHG